MNTDLQKVINSVLGIKNYIVGGTDGTPVGNTSDKLKVEATLSANTSASSAAFTSKTRVIVQTSNINLVTGSYTTIYTYSGSGFLYGFNIEFNNIGVIPKLEVDGEVIFSGTTIATLNSLVVTASTAARLQSGAGIITSSSSLDWSLKQPIKFNSSVTISADAGGGGLLTRSFNQGVFYLSKET